MGMASGVGFFGKVTSHGDFVSRRLAPAFVQPWDGWLQQGLQASKAALGPRWLAIYMNSPIWRFALAPGVCGQSAWAGLVMPSVDRVGRHFPLTLAAELAAASSLPDCLTRHAAWFARLEELALSSLVEQFSLDDFDAALSMLETPLAAPAPVSAPAPASATASLPPATVIALDQAQALEPQLQAAGDTGLLRDIAAAALAGQGLWWTDGSPQVAPCVALSRGLPPPAAFAALLDGDWRGHGWPGA